MKILGVISARAGSKGVEGKNLRPLGGRPLIAHMIAAAQKAVLIDRLILTTEDETIAETGRSCGIEVPFMRPEDLASDAATGIQVAKHAMEAMDALGGRADVIAHLFPTCPFLRPESIDAGIRMVLDGYDSAVGVQDSGHCHPYRAMVFDGRHTIRPFLDNPAAELPVNRQDLPDVWARCGALYVRRRRLLEEWDGAGFCLGEKRAGVKLDPVEAVNIDTEIDLLFAEFIMEQRGAP